MKAAPSQFCVVLLLGLSTWGLGIAKLAQGQIDSIQPLLGDDESLQTRIELIDSAEFDIAISTYHIEPGKSTNLLLGALSSAAQRGVRVRLLLDALNMELSASQISALQQAGASVRLFHPIGKGGVKWLNRRLHSKLFIVDCRYLIVGSRNLRDKHFGLDCENYIDLEVLIEGTAAHEAAQYLDWIWDSNHVESVCESNKRYCTKAGLHHTPVGIEPVCRESCPVFQAPICSLHDRCLYKSHRQMQHTRLIWMKSAGRSLVIETPYPAFSKTTLSALVEVAERGVSVSIYTNSLATTDQKLAFAAFKNSQRTLLRSGVKIYEYQGPDTMHAKMMLIDDRTAVLGSHNSDSRSDFFNLEFCVRVECPELVDCLRANMMSRFEGTVQRTSPAIDRSLPLRDRCKLRATQVAAPLLRPLL